MTERSPGTGPAGHHAPLALRLGCWPATSEHDYLRSFYQALAGHGARVSIDGLRFEDAFLRRERGRLDVLHLHWPEHMWGAGRASASSRLRGVAGMAMYLRTARRLGLPVLWTVHNLEPHENGDWIDALGYAVLARGCRLAIFHDDHARETFRRRFPRAGCDTLVMRHGHFGSVWPHPGERGAIRAGLGISAEERLLVGFGTLRPYKGFELAIDAVAQLGSPYRLLIAGPPTDPAYAASLEARAAGSARATVKVGRLSPQDLVDVIRAADVTLFPYRDITGSGALLGTVTVGRGFIASDLPYFRQMLAIEPHAGVLCAPADVGALGEAIEQYFTEADEVRDAAVARLTAAHEWNDVVIPVARWIERLVAPAPAVAASPATAFYSANPPVLRPRSRMHS